MRPTGPQKLSSTDFKKFSSSESGISLFIFSLMFSRLGTGRLSCLDRDKKVKFRNLRE